MGFTVVRKPRLGSLGFGVALVLAGCSTPDGMELGELRTEQAAVTGQSGTMLFEEESIFFVQRRSLAEIGSAAVTLANGHTLFVDEAANSARRARRSAVIRSETTHTTGRRKTRT